MIGTRVLDVPCRIAIEQSEAHFHAHIELAGAIDIAPGDRVTVHGEPIRVAFGESLVLERRATVVRAGALLRGWTRLASYLGLTELYEVSFTSGSLR